MANDGSVMIQVDLDDKEANKRLEKLKKEIEKTEKAVATTDAKHNGIVEALDKATEAAERTRNEIKEINAQIAENESVLSGQDSGGRITLEEFNARKQAQAELAYELKEQEKTYASQVKEVEKLEKQEQAVRTTLEQQRQTLEQQKRDAGNITQSLSKQSKSILPALNSQTKEITKSMNKGFKNILKWGFGIRSAFILMRRLRGAITEGIKEYAKYDEDTKKSLDGLKMALKQLKVSWGAAFAPIIQTVAPSLQTLVGWVTKAADAVNQLFSLLQGKTSYRKAVVKNEELEESYEEAGEAAEEATKSLMGFDEINKLSSEDSATSTKGKDEDEEENLMYEEVPITSGFAKTVGDIVKIIKDHLLDLQLFAYGMALGLGLILTLSGANIPLGLALIALGAYGLAKTLMENWGIITANVQSVLGAINIIVGGALLAIGAVLAFSGTNIPLGLALMAIGAAALATGIALSWEEIPAHIKAIIAAIALVLGGALLAVGAIFVFTGANIPLGIALMVLGALSIASGLALNWDYITSNIKNVVAAIGLILGGALLVLGAVILFATPSFSPLGLGLLIAGAALLASSVALNWDYIGDKIKGETGRIVAIISAALLVLGVILTFSGASVPLGIGLMAAGAVGLATTAALNWDKIVHEINGPLGRIMAVLGVSLLAVGAILAFSGVGLPLGIALMLAGCASLGGAVALNWNAIPDKISEILTNIVNKFTEKYAELKNKTAELKKSIVEKATELKNGVVEKMGEMRERVNERVDALKEGFLSRIDRLRQNAQSRFDAIKNYFSNIITKIRNLMNFKWSFPKPKMPHFKVTWQQLGRWFSLPRVSIEWYARGGVFDKASLIGVGENGSEAVVPLEKNTGWMNTVADGIVSRLLDSNRFSDAITGHTLPAMASGSVVPLKSIQDSSSEMYEAIRKGVVDAFNGIQSSGGVFNININATFKANGKEFYRATWTDLKAVESEHGMTLILNG